MKHDLSRDLEEYVKGDFNLLRELDGAAQKSYLAAAVADGPLAVLVLHSTRRGELELEEIRELSAAHGIGSTVCWACTRVSPGWPRFCPGCARDLSGTSAAEHDAAGAGERAAQALRRQWPGARLLGSIPYAAGGGAMHFVQQAGGEAEQGHAEVPAAGIVMDRGEQGADVLVPRWAMDRATLDRLRDGPAPGVGHPVRAEPSVPSNGSQDEDEPAGEGPAPRRRVPRTAWAVAALVLVALAFVSLTSRSSDSSVEPRGPDSTAASPIDSTRDSDTVVPAPVDPEPRTSEKKRTNTPAQDPDSAVEPDTLTAPEPLLDPDLDRRQVIAAASAFAAAFQTRDIGRVRSAYPDMAPGEEAEWTRWFRRIESLSVGFFVDSVAHPEGDLARAEFTLPIRSSGRGYSRQLHCMALRATLRRGADGWYLHRLEETQRLTTRECALVEQKADRHDGTR